MSEMAFSCHVAKGGAEASDTFDLFQGAGDANNAFTPLPVCACGQDGSGHHHQLF